MQRRLWNQTALAGNIWNSPANEYQEVGRSTVRFAGTADILAAMDALFGFDGTQEFLKDNLFEVKNYKTYPLQITTIYFFRHLEGLCSGHCFGFYLEFSCAYYTPCDRMKYLAIIKLICIIYSLLIFNQLIRFNSTKI